jgi:hypothetical protein
MKESKKVLVTFELENDLYFKVLEACVAERITLDEFVEKALRSFIDKYGKKKAAKRR